MSDVKHVYQAMIAVKKRVSELGLAKERSAPAAAGGFQFRGIDDLYNLLCGIEAAENLLVFPRVLTERTEYQENKSGKAQTHVHVTMEFKFVSAVDGSSDVASAIGEGIDTSDKASGKAQSNAMKQGHLQAYKIPTEGEYDVENDDEQVGRRTSGGSKPSSEHSAAEREIASLFERAQSTQDIADAEARAHKAIGAKLVVNGGRERLLRHRSDAIARVEGGR